MATLSDITKEIKNKFKKSNPDMVYDPKKFVEFIESGCFMFDMISGGGFPRKRLSEVFGMEQSGKTSLIYATLAKLQREGKVGVLLDFEGAWDPVYAKKTFGLVRDGELFEILSPDNIEEGDEVVELLKKLDTLDLVAFDSVDAMKPKALIECALDGKVEIAAHARAIARFVVKMKVLAKKKNTAMVFTNQMRKNIQMNKYEFNSGTGSGFNTQESYTIPGGNALRFYASMRMKLEFGKRMVDENAIDGITGEKTKKRIGNIIKVINIKNKVYTPFLKGSTHFDFVTPDQQGGWREEKDILDLLKKRGRVTQKGVKFVYNGLNEKWENSGSKVSSEQLFFGNGKLMKDARELINELLESDNILDTVSEDDIKEGELKGQDELIDGDVESGDGIKEITL